MKQNIIKHCSIIMPRPRVTFMHRFKGKFTKKISYVMRKAIPQIVYNYILPLVYDTFKKRHLPDVKKIR